ncbi:MAG: hypothetical protein J6V06_05625 [Clostridia bacterium]|nr:hypothetical protein [Clostridia bacterium]
MSVFDDARQATEELFENDEQTVEEIPAEVEETPAEETETIEQTEEVPEEENAVLNDAVNTAEIAAQAAQERDMQLQQALQDIETLRAQNEQMQGTIEELSQKNEENLIEEAMQMPTIDLNGLAFATEEEQAKALADYAQKMSEFVKGGVMQELSPFVEQAKAGIYEREKADALSALSAVPELAGINDMLPQLERIISANKWLQSEDMPMDEKYINAYAIARGVNAINTPPEEPKELTSEELMELYDKNPSFQELVEKKRLDAIKQSQQVPPFSASSGAVNAALNIKDKPTTFEEASKRTRQMFGLE